MTVTLTSIMFDKDMCELSLSWFSLAFGVDYSRFYPGLPMALSWFHPRFSFAVYSSLFVESVVSVAMFLGTSGTDKGAL